MNRWLVALALFFGADIAYAKNPFNEMGADPISRTRAAEEPRGWAHREDAKRAPKR